MEWIIVIKLFAIVLLVLGNAFFVGSEIALTSARRSRIKQLAGMGNRSAMMVQVLHDEPERFYSVTQIGITLVSLGLGAIGILTITQLVSPGLELMFSPFGSSEDTAQWAHGIAYVIAFLAISFLHVVAGELAPKVFAFHKAVSVSLTVSWVINGLYRITYPLIWVMNRASNALLWLLGQGELATKGDTHFAMTAEEIRTILSSGEKEGALPRHISRMLRGVFDLDEHIARDAMTPLTDITALPSTATVSETMRLFKENSHARYPVYEEYPDNVVGVIAMKELMTKLADTEGIPPDHPVTEVMLPPYFVPDTMPLNKLLQNFISKRRQLAIVLDEYGGTAGLITLEDLLEEIVGEYSDEFTPRHRKIVKKAPGQYAINGEIRVRELEPRLNFPFPLGDYVTLGGLIHHRLCRIPEVGDVVELEGGRLKVLKIDGHRISQVMFEDLAIALNNENATKEHIPEVQQKTKEAKGSSDMSAKKPPKESTATLTATGAGSNVALAEKQDSAEIDQQPNRKAQK